MKTTIHLLLLFVVFHHFEATETDEVLSISMPLAKPTQPETYLCTALKLNQTSYALGFEALAKAEVAHHLLLFTCGSEAIFSENDAFECGEMSHKIVSTSCRLIYAWAKNAHQLRLPDDVAFEVSGWLVLQVHYASTDKVPEKGDDTTVVLRVTPEKQPKAAGVYLLSTGGLLPPNAVTRMETACQIRQEDIEMHPFAFRVHTHELGESVSGYKVFKLGSEWSLLGQADPQLPQTFNPVENENEIIVAGDAVAARCVMNNVHNHTVKVGPTSKDEMCNFYIMYWVDEESELLREKLCRSPGPPNYYWDRDGFKNVPSAEGEKV